MRISAEQVLRSYAQPSRVQIARARGLEAKGKGTEELIRLLKPLLFGRDQIQRALAELSAPERALLDQLILLGDASAELVRTRLEEDGHVAERPKTTMWTSYREFKGSPWARDSTKFEDLVARLGVLGLAFSANPTMGGALELSSPGQRLYIPDEVLQQLPAVTIPPVTAESPALIRAADPGALRRDVYLLLSVAREGPIPLTARGQIVKRSLTQIAGLLRHSEPVAEARSEDDLTRLPLLRALAEELRVLASRQNALQASDELPSFMALPPGRRQKSLFDAYCATAQWCELFHVPGLTIRTSGPRRPVPEAIGAARRRVVAEVAELPPGQWIPVDHLIDRLRRRAYELLLPRRWPASSYGLSHWAPDPYSGDNAWNWVFEEVSDAEDGWDLVEGGFIRVVATQALHWLGLVDVGYRDDQLVAFRVTADGAGILRGQPVAEGPLPAPNVVVQPNFQLFALAPTDESVLFRLDQIAERVRVDQAIEYRLTRESIYQAQRAGWDVQRILSCLDEVSTVPLPQNVLRTIEEWGAEQERVVVRRGVVLLQAADEPTLDALYADPVLAQLLGRRVAPTAALAPAANLDALYRTLLDHGPLPALSEGPGATPEPAFTLDASGTIRFHQPAPSMYVLQKLRPFTDGDTPPALRLTPASLRRGAKEGLGPEQVLATLEAFHLGPLPPEIVALVGRQARVWGRGALSEVMLLQVESEETLADLLADPAINRHLQPLPGAPALAVVRRGGVADLKKALQAREIELQDHLLP